ncbi:MAG: hypothetical protein LBS73_07025 [Campylobacteraceae bacterium]|jgi:hypothetical protein|nr:hypothetical protein [Campylobacteraceae bacterium]
MSRLFKLIFLVLVSAFLVGCGEETANNNAPQSTAQANVAEKKTPSDTKNKNSKKVNNSCDYSTEIDSVFDKEVHIRHIPNSAGCEELRADGYIDDQGTDTFRFEQDMQDTSGAPVTHQTMTLNKDEWKMVDKKKGEYGQFGGEWPDIELTRQLPKPNMPIAAISEEVRSKGKELSVIFVGNSTIEEKRAYAKQLENKGFTIDVNSKERPMFSSFHYKAKNRAGYAVQFICIGAACTLGLNEPAK